MNETMNLDALEPNELRHAASAWEYAARNSSTQEYARILGFDAGTGYAQNTLKKLVKYARTKAQAFEARIEGRINDALGHESVCDRIYDQLPEKVRW